MTPRPDVALKTEAILGEGALWDDRRQRLLWVDILQEQVGIFDPVSRTNRMLKLNSVVGAVVPTQGDDLMASVQEGFVRLDPESGHQSAAIIPRGHNPAHVRFNDGKCDPRGRFWAGTMALDGSGSAGVLYSLETSGTVLSRFAPVGISNGLAWNLDCTRMYYIDTPKRCLTTFAYDPDTGAVSTPRVAIEFPPGLGWPDGMTIDAEGMLWIAFWDGGAVSRWNPDDGQLLEQFDFPVRRPTTPAFGGPNLDVLYLTSARLGLSKEQLATQPLAGSIFAVPTKARGLPSFRFKG